MGFYGEEFEVSQKFRYTLGEAFCPRENAARLERAASKKAVDQLIHGIESGRISFPTLPQEQRRLLLGDAPKEGVQILKVGSKNFAVNVVREGDVWSALNV